MQRLDSGCRLLLEDVIRVRAEGDSTMDVRDYLKILQARWEDSRCRHCGRDLGRIGRLVDCHADLPGFHAPVRVDFYRNNRERGLPR